MKAWNKKYFKRFWLGMVGYILLLPISVWLLDNGRISFGPGRYFIALLPVLPFFYTMLAAVANVRQLDELQRRIHLESVLITALLTGAITFSYGLLEANELLPSLSWDLIAPMMIAIWGLATAIISRRYR